MRPSVFATIAAIAAIAAALPTSTNHVLHEKRSGSSSWSPKQGVKPDGRIKLPVRIGLTESNLHLGDEILMRTSDPASEHYGKHMTSEQVRRYPTSMCTTWLKVQQIAELFAPAQGSIDSVHSWLVNSGVESSRITLSRGRNWLNFDASIAEVESLLRTEYKVYTHASGQDHIACEDYSVPQELSEHIDVSLFGAIAIYSVSSQDL